MNINDIARLAGVSRTTVSRVLHGGYVSEEARLRVQAIIAQTGYVPNARAQAFRMQKSNLICVILSSLGSEFTRAITEYIINEAESLGYQTIILRYMGSTKRMLNQIRQMQGQNVDGMIVFYLSNDENLEQKIGGSTVPIVTIGPSALPGIAGIIHDDEAAFTLLTQGAIDAGYTKIGALFPLDHSTLTYVRRKAVLDTLEKNHIPIHPEWFIDVDYGAMEHSYYGVQIGKYIQQMPSRPEAFLAASDLIACSVIQQLRRYGIQVPQDIAISGSGDIELGRLLDPQLTTTRVDSELIANRSLNLLLSQIEKKQTLDSHEIVQPTLVRRESL